MNRLLKKSLILGCIGFAMGMAIGITIYYLTDVRMLGKYEITGQTIFELMLGGIQGFLAMSSSVVYEIESWSIARATVTHFLVTIGGFYTMGYLQGWLKPGSRFFIIMTTVFIVVYFIIWLIQYLRGLNDVKKMNDDLEKMKRPPG